MTIYLNLDSDEVYTEEEVMECYDRDVAQLIADNPVPQLPTYDEWLQLTATSLPIIAVNHGRPART